MSLILTASPSAQGEEFSTHRIGGSFTNPSQVELADLDGDGDADVILRGAWKLAAFFNLDGAGTFGPQVYLDPPGELVSRFALEDFDADGDIDVVAVKGNNVSMAFYANDGQGHFEAPVPVATGLGGAPLQLTAGDADGDGDPDIVFGQDTGLEVRWLRNNGAGEFSGPFDLVPGGSAADLHLVDLSNDGLEDILCSTTASDGSGNQEARWYPYHRVSGTWGLPVVLVTYERIRLVLPADFDGDGDQDVLVGLDSAAVSSVDDLDELRWYENAGGQWIEHSLVNDYCASSIVPQDIDGDGDLDLLLSGGDMGCSADTHLRWAENLDGAGDFGPAQAIYPGFDYGLANAGDIDGDGHSDIVGAMTTIEAHFNFDYYWWSYVPRSEFGWLRNVDGQGSFDEYQSFSFEAADAQSAASGDMDGDGDLDLLSYSLLDEEIAWYENTGSGEPVFGAQATVTSTASGGPAKNVTHLVTVDLNGNGFLDVLWGGEGRIAETRNLDGQGGFSGPVEIATFAPDLNSLSAPDLDGDGSPDILLSSGYQTLWLANTNGLGSFGPAQPLAAYAFSDLSSAPADLDGDGDLDIAQTGRIADTVSWFENDGLGGFGQEIVVSAAIEGPTAVEPIDFDGDGDVDLVVAQGSEDKLWAFRNWNGLGAFDPPAIVGGTEDYPSALASGDLDGDGDEDLVAYSYISREIASYENLDGTGNFGPRTVIEGHGDARMVATVDLDGDGDVDVLSALAKENHIAWYESVSCPGLVEVGQVVRLGSPANPLAFLPGVTTGPVLAGTWDPVIDHTSFGPPGAVLDFAVISAGPANLPTPLGTFLCDLTSLITIVGAPSVGEPFQIAIPPNCTYAGLSLCVQGGSADASGFYAIANALDITIGTSD